MTKCFCKVTTAKFCNPIDMQKILATVTFLALAFSASAQKYNQYPNLSASFPAMRSNDLFLISRDGTGTVNVAFGQLTTTNTVWENVFSYATAIFVPNATFDTNATLYTVTPTEDTVYRVDVAHVTKQETLGQVNDFDRTVGLSYTAASGDTLRELLCTFNQPDGITESPSGFNIYSVLNSKFLKVKAGGSLNITNRLRITTADNYLGTNYFELRVSRAASVPMIGGGVGGSSDAAIWATNAPDGRTFKSPALAKTAYRIPDVGFSRDNNDPGDFHGSKHSMALADQGFFNIAFINSEYTNENAAATIDVMLNYYGWANVPVGVSTNMRYVAGDNRWHHLATNSNLPYPPLSIYNSNYPSTTAVARKALAESADTNFVYDVEGSLREAYDVFISGPDAFSPLDGTNLFARKMQYMFINGGMLKEVSAFGTTNINYNFEVDIPAAQGLVNYSTVPIVFNPISFSNTLEWPNIFATNVIVGENLIRPEIHPADSPLFMLATNATYYRPGWDAFALMYISAAALNGHFTSGTNGIDGEPQFSIVGPGRAWVHSDGKIGWSNFVEKTIGSGVYWPTNHYYIITNGVYRNGRFSQYVNSFIDASPARGGTQKHKLQSRERQFILENFGFGQNVTTPGAFGIGENGWMYYGSSSGGARQRRLAGYLGVYQIQTAATSGTVAGVGANFDTSTATGSWEMFPYGWEAKIRFQLNETNDVFHRIGFVGVASTGPTTNELSGVYLRHRTSTDGSTFKFVCRATAAGPGESTANSIIPVDTGWHTLTIRRGYPPYSNGVSFSIDGEPEQFISGNVPQWSTPCALVGTETAAAKTVWLDWWRFDMPQQ